jgi:hypothetical protein
MTEPTSPPTIEDKNETTKPAWVSHIYTILPSAANNAILMLPSPQGWRLPYLRAENIWLSETGRIIPLLRENLGFDFAFTILRHIAYDENEQDLHHPAPHRL